MVLRDMQHDGPRLEQNEIAFCIGGNLPEGVQRAVRGFLHRLERHQANLIRLAHFFQRPAHAHVARESPAAIGRTLKGGDGGNHGKAPGDGVTPWKSRGRVEWQLIGAPFVLSVGRRPKSKDMPAMGPSTLGRFDSARCAGYAQRERLEADGQQAPFRAECIFRTDKPDRCWLRWLTVAIVSHAAPPRSRRCRFSSSPSWPRTRVWRPRGPGR